MRAAEYAAAPGQRQTEGGDDDQGNGVMNILAVAGDAPSPFQVMPDLTDDELDALREDIAARGVLVPVVVDQHGRILDGHHRSTITAELGIDCPTEVRQVADDDEATEIALTLNLARRHLTREQKRELIRREADRRPDDSDRAIARRVGCSPSTVAAVRRPTASNLDTTSDVVLDVDEELKALTIGVYDSLNPRATLPTSDADAEFLYSTFVQEEADIPFSLAMLLAFVKDIDPTMIGAQIACRMSLWKSCGIDRRAIRRRLSDWLDFVYSPSALASVYEHGGYLRDQAGEGLDSETVERLLDHLASIPDPLGLGGEAR